MIKTASRLPAVILAVCLMMVALMGASMACPAYAVSITVLSNSGGIEAEAQSAPSMGQDLGDFCGEAEVALMSSDGPSSMFDSNMESIMDHLDNDRNDDWASDTGSFVQTVGNITVILLIVFGVLGVGLNLIGGLLLISAWRNSRMGQAIAGSILFTVSVLISFNVFSLIAAVLGWVGIIASNVGNRT